MKKARREAGFLLTLIPSLDWARSYSPDRVLHVCVLTEKYKASLPGLTWLGPAMLGPAMLGPAMLGPAIPSLDGCAYWDRPDEKARLAAGFLPYRT
jgi:hypothetical protein